MRPACGNWSSEARAPLEQLETEFARGEYPPFDRWYHESWIRSADSPTIRTGRIISSAPSSPARGTATSRLSRLRFPGRASGMYERVR